MLYVKIKSIKRPGHLLTKEYTDMLMLLDKPLRVMSVDFEPDTGKIWAISVWSPEEMGSNVVTLFIGTNGVKYELLGTIQLKNYWEEPHEGNR